MKTGTPYREDCNQEHGVKASRTPVPSVHSYASTYHELLSSR